jgi:hypothetical protein
MISDREGTRKHEAIRRTLTSSIAAEKSSPDSTAGCAGMGRSRPRTSSRSFLHTCTPCTASDYVIGEAPAPVAVVTDNGPCFRSVTFAATFARDNPLFRPATRGLPRRRTLRLASCGAGFPMAAAKITDDVDELMALQRLPRRARGAPADHQLDRINLRRGAAPHQSHQGPPAREPPGRRWRSSSSRQPRIAGVP